jgi:phosphoglycerate dehydrogenase-like enzyme
MWFTPPMVRVLHHTNAGSLQALAAEFPDVTFVQLPTDGPIDPDVRGEILLTGAYGAPSLPEALERGVRWIHTIGTGVDRFPLDLVGDRTLTCSRGASAIGIAEWTLATMLAFAKRLPESWIDAPPERWNLAKLDALHGATVGIVGMGAIGERIARLCRAFDMRVVGLRRTPRPSDVEGVEIVTSLHDALATADHVVIAAPATPDTRHLVDDDAIAAMRPGVHLVNIARGALVDQDALRRGLDSGHIACASLDVVDPEPLPAGHWLYTHPKVRLSPHISWSMPTAYDLLYETFRTNLSHWLAGQPLEGVVDVGLGY